MNDPNGSENTDDKKDEVTVDIDNHKMDVKWTEEHENILIEWADKAMCFRWLHSKAHMQFSAANTWFTIPVIIMSTITGTANFAQDKFPEDIKQYAVMGIGAVNLFAGILTTIQQFLKIGELNESHRVSSISWDKFYRNIKIELAKSPDERIPAYQMLKIAKEEFDRLMETSPAIADDIIEQFQKTFDADIEDEHLSERRQVRKASFFELKKPEICDDIRSCKHSVYKRKPGEKQTKVNIQLAKKALKQKQDQERVEQIINDFNSVRKRPPTEDEIMDELDDQIEVQKETITSILNDFQSVINDNVIIDKKDGSNQ